MAETPVQAGRPHPSRLVAAWSALLVALLASAIAAAAWLVAEDLDDARRAWMLELLSDRAPVLVLLALALAAAVGVVLHAALRPYTTGAARLAEEIHLLHTVHPGHRAVSEGPPEMRRLVGEINAFAQAHEALQRDLEARVEESNRRTEQEKRRLAALMSELAQSVIVCNAEGRILLYNTRATELLAPQESAQDDAGAAAAPVGLGRSVFGVLDKPLIVHALDRIRHAVDQGDGEPVAHVVTARGDRLLRVQVAPVMSDDARGTVSGFVLILEDITQSVQANSRRDLLLRQLTEGTRASLANIRAAAETVQHYPDMDAQRRERFTAVIRDEAQQLSERLHETLAAHGDTLRTQWPREDMLASDLVRALQRNLAHSLGVPVVGADDADPLWLSVDSFALVQALTHLAGRIVDTCHARELGLELAPDGRLLRLSLRWKGAPVLPDQLHAWEAESTSPALLAGATNSLREVLDRHGGELWCGADHGNDGHQVCVELPLAHSEGPRRQSAATQSRPVYYDFDLFERPVHTPELDDRPLLELSYTVFDTETTGLSPSEGDEIISIGAVRVVNGRLLEQECFDQLVNPRRSIRRESQAVHGITEAMLAGQPDIARVLPLFHRFAEDTVLVAHNAAFDMRFLQMKEASTGVRFVQPVLDTLLLSALAHPGHEDADHRLERIAERLGIHVIGRHTALGDAIVTGEVFLKLLPLLAERGIRTLRQAREASRQSRYAKLDY